MDAIISGRAGIGLLVDGEELFSFDVSEPDNLVRRTHVDLRFVFGDIAGIREISGINHQDAVQALRQDYDCACSLDLALMTLDGELSLEARGDTAEALDELLADPIVRDYLGSIFYVKPLPLTADIRGAKDCCLRGKLQHLRDFWLRLEDLQPAIRAVDIAWDRLPLQLFSSNRERQQFHNIAVREGLFRDLVDIFDDANKIGMFCIAALKNEAVKTLPNHRAIIQQWVQPLTRVSAVPRDALNPEAADELSKARRHRQPNRISSGSARDRISRQKAAILQALDRYDLPRARAFIADLISAQREYSRPEHIAKSLCDLATEAKARGLHQLQLELARESTEIAPGDGWAWTQYADALLELGHLDQALQAYDEGNSFGEDETKVVAQNGRAHVLKAMGKFEEALSAFGDLIRVNPNDVFAQNGRAEVLKAMGKFEDALSVFNDIILIHPESVVAQNGRAEVLKGMGKFKEALSAFDGIIHAYPQDVVAQTGRAEVLKGMGKFEESLSAFDDVIRAHPENAVAQTGRAEVLKGMGKFEEALSAFDAVIRAHPENAVAQTGRAEVLKGVGKFEEALSAFDGIIRAHPGDVVAQNGRAEVLKGMGKFEEALSAFDAVIRAHPHDVVAQNGRAEVLKGMGKFDQAISAFDAVIRAHPHNVVAQNGRAEVLKAMGKFEEALSAFDAVIRAHPHDLVAKSGRSCVLAALGFYKEALAGLPTEKPIGISGWIAWHIRGMTLLRSGSVDEALRLFEYGVKTCPWSESQEYFRSALALALMRQQRFAEAARNLEQIHTIRLPQTNVIRIHVYGALQDDARAQAAYQNVIKGPWRWPALMDELHSRFILKQPPGHSDEWLHDREEEALLAA